MTNAKTASRMAALGLALVLPGVRVCGQEPLPRLPATAANLLLSATVSGNLESCRKGLRGAPDHLIWDTRKGDFARESMWHEYGVGFGADLGVVPEAEPLWWLAVWQQPVDANLIVLSGVYPNQPQPETAWKIEVRLGGTWREHARGIGGWYDQGRYVWGGPGTEPMRLEALRVSVFSEDPATPLASVHFRGEEKLSWFVANVAPIDAAIRLPSTTVRATRSVALSAVGATGPITSWRWDFGDGTQATGMTVNHAFAKPGAHTVALTLSDGQHTATTTAALEVLPPVEVALTPLSAPVMAGDIVRFRAEAHLGEVTEWAWDFGDGRTATGQTARYTFAAPGIRRVRVTGSVGAYSDTCVALVRVHTADTLAIPQVVLDTDQKNEQDDQHYSGYALFSELDVLGVNSVHHGGGQEPANYAELVHVLDLARQSGLPARREPFLFRGANQRLAVPDSGRWEDTAPIRTEASAAILAAARGAAPTNPVWVVPVGPGTNVASAILQARAEGLDLRDRVRVVWLGGSNDGITQEFNGNNDPWSMVVVGRSGLPTWIVPAPVGARVAIDKRTEGHLYADHPLGQYLKSIVPDGPKPLFDPSCLSVIISERLGLGWVKEAEPVTIAGPEGGYRWTKGDATSAVRVIRQIDQGAMRTDIFDTMKGKPTRLVGAAGP